MHTQHLAREVLAQVEWFLYWLILRDIDANLVVEFVPVPKPRT